MGPSQGGRAPEKPKRAPEGPQEGSDKAPTHLYHDRAVFGPSWGPLGALWAPSWSSKRGPGQGGRAPEGPQEGSKRAPRRPLAGPKRAPQ
eukprot:957144-Pyramimonas_sp.AAC.1